MNLLTLSTSANAVDTSTASSGLVFKASKYPQQRIERSLLVVDINDLVHL